MTPTFLVQAAGEMMMPFTEMETRARIVDRERGEPEFIPSHQGHAHD